MKRFFLFFALSVVVWQILTLGLYYIIWVYRHCGTCAGIVMPLASILDYALFFGIILSFVALLVLVYLLIAKAYPRKLLALILVAIATLGFYILSLFGYLA